MSASHSIYNYVSALVMQSSVPLKDLRNPETPSPKEDGEEKCDWEPIRRAPFYLTFKTFEEHDEYLAKHSRETKSTDKEEKEEELLPTDILVRGCDGTGDEVQEAVAALHRTISAKVKPDFYVHTGDVIYKHGATSATDKRFEVFDKYGEEKKVCFQVPGNHDHDMHRGCLVGGQTNPNKYNYFLKRTVCTNGEVDPKKVAALSRKIHGRPCLILEELEKLGMTMVAPDRFYGFEYYKRGIECYFADSNTFVKEYIAYMGDQEPDPKHNQAAYFSELLHKTSKPKIMFMHIPFDPVNKLACEPDTHIFLSPSDHVELAKLLGKDTSKLGYGEIMKSVFEKLGILDKIKVYYVAHNHALYEFIDGKFRVAVVGGGGEASQPQADFSKPRKVPFYSAEDEEDGANIANKHGIAHAHIEPRAGYKVTNTYYHCDKSILQFSGTNETDYAVTEDEDVTKFRKTVLDACADCLDKYSYKADGLILAPAQRLPTRGFWGIPAMARSLAEWGTPSFIVKQIEKLRRALNILAAKEIHSEKIPLKDYVETVVKAVTAIPALIEFLDKLFQTQYKMTYGEFIKQFSPEPVALQSGKPSTSEELKVPPTRTPSPEIKKTDATSPSGKEVKFSPDDETTAKNRLRDIVIKACREYKIEMDKLKIATEEQASLLSRIASFPSLWGHGDGGIERMTKLQTYYDGEYNSNSFMANLTFVNNALLTGFPGKNSLITFVKNGLKAELGLEYDDLFRLPSLILRDKVGIELTTPPLRSSAIPIPRVSQAIPTPLQRSPGACSLEARTPVSETPMCEDMVFVPSPSRA